MSDTIEGVSRHDFLPQTGCEGPCEGTGYVPVYMAEGDRRGSDSGIVSPSEEDIVLVHCWREAERENPSHDGWHFVKGPVCDGAMPVEEEATT